MELKLTFSFVIVAAVLAICSANDVDDVSNQVINIYGGNRAGSLGTHNCVSETYMKDTMRELLVNISGILKEEANIKDNAETGKRKPRDCQDIHDIVHNTTGIYTIYPGDGNRGIKVRCDMDTTSGGWTVIQRRVSDSDFFKTWFEYKTGFGNLSDNFWLGNDNIHIISTQNMYQLRVDLTTNDDETAFAEYQIFFIGDGDSDYRLLVDWFIGGNAGDSLENHNGQKFSTKDRDNDKGDRHCAQIRFGGWWYNDCLYSNLNGDYGNKKMAEGPVWYPWRESTDPMKMTEMKIRPWRA